MSFLFALFSHQYIHSCDNSVIILKDDMVYQTDLELHHLMYVFLQSSPDFVFILLVLSSIPALNKCQIKDPELMDKLLKARISQCCLGILIYLIIYFHLISISSMADFAPTWGTHCEEGGFMLSDALALYNSPDKKSACSLLF